MIDPKDVTPGYWYVLKGSVFGFDSYPRLYEIVDVQEDGGVAVMLDDNIQTNKYHPSWVFLAPVPDLIGKPEEALKDLRQKLGLPSNASTSDVFRAALDLARKAAKEARDNDG